MLTTFFYIHTSVSKLLFAKPGNERGLVSAELQKAREMEISIESNILK